MTLDILRHRPGRASRNAQLRQALTSDVGSAIRRRKIAEIVWQKDRHARLMEAASVI
jgi:hypothetical protein